MFPYIVISFLIVLCAFWGKKSQLGRIFAFVLVALFVGLRYKVGTDYESYSDYFYTSLFFLEPGFNALITYLSQYENGEAYMFLTMSFVTYLFLYLYVEFNNDIKEAGYFPTVLMFTLLTITTTCNGIRQALAASIFVFSTLFIKNRKLPIFLVLIGFGFLFHRSILFVLPFYFIKDYHLKSWMYIIVYAISFIFTQYDLQTLVTPFQFLIENNDRYMHMVEENYGTSYLGLGNFMQIVTYIILLWLALRNKMHEKYPFYFNMFFITCVLMNMRIGASLFDRLMMYFSWFTFVLLSLTLKEEKKQNIKKVYTLFYITWYIISSFNYIVFDKHSMLMPYHDVLGIF